MKVGIQMSKETFNVTELTKKVYGIEDTNSAIFETNRKRIAKHIKAMQKMLGHPITKFEAPINQLEAYTGLIRNILDNADNDGALDFLNKKLLKEKPLTGKIDEESLTSLINIHAEALKEVMNGDEGELLEKLVKAQISNDYYINSEKNMHEARTIIENDFLFFNELNNLEAKLEYQEQYMNDIRMVSALYRSQVEDQILFGECVIEVIKSHPELNKKTMYTTIDILTLPSNIQQEIYELVQSKQKTPF